MRKTICAFTVLLLVFGCNMVFARGNNAAAGFNISIYHETGNHPQPASNHPMYRYLNERTGVSFTWDILVGDAQQKQGVMIASGDYPDILELRGNQWIQARALIPLEDLILQYAPRLRALYTDVLWEQLKSEDGHIYYWLNYGVFQGVDWTTNYDQAAFWIQKEVLRWANFPAIKTVDQYFDLIERYYNANPTINGQPTIPFMILTDDWRAFELWNPPNFLAGNPNDGNGIVNNSTYEYRAFFTEDISRRWFQKLNELDKRGLIDRTSFTDNMDQYGAKIASGRVLGQSIQGWQFSSFDNANRDRGEGWRTMAPLPITWDESTRPWYRNVTIPNFYRGGGISRSAKDPVRIMQFLNELLAEDIQRTLNWGIEGESWQYNAQRIPYRTAAQRTTWDNQNWQEQNRALLMGDVMPKIQGSFSDGYPADLGQYFPEREAGMRDYDIAVYNAYGVTSYNDMMDRSPRPNNLWFPTWSMENATPPSGSPAQLAISEMEQIMKQRLPAMILAPADQFNTLWTQYITEMTNAGLEEYNRHMQTELNARLRQWSGGRITGFPVR